MTKYKLMPRIGMRIFMSDKVAEAIQNKVEDITIGLMKTAKDTAEKTILKEGLSLDDFDWENGPRLEDLSRDPYTGEYVAFMKLYPKENKKAMTDIDYCKGTTPDGQICPRRDLCSRWAHYLALRRTGLRHDYLMAWDGGDCPMFQLRKFQGD